MNEAAKAGRREYMRRWREKNREQYNAYQRSYRKENPEKVREYQERYYEKIAKEMMG